MKRIYTTLALMGALVTGAFAQRHANISGTLIIPTDPATATTVGCSDSFAISYLYINEGPDAILATDTMSFNDAFTNPYKSAYRVTGTAFAVGDTVFGQSGYAALSDIDFLWDATSGAVDTTKPFNGSYLFPVIFGGYGWAAVSTSVVDTTDGDNQLGFLLNITCNTTGIKDLKNGVSLNVYPNPASNQVSFNYDFTAATVASLRVTDISGRVVKTITLGKQNTGSKTFNVDIADLNNGMYYIELVTETSRSISKFTKN